MSQTDSIQTRGFLSKENEIYRTNYRTKYAELFAVCEAKSDAASARLFNTDLSALDVPEQFHVLLALGLWCRCLRACQGAILLLERGMVPEAQTLVRSAYEFLFYAAAGVNNPGIMESMKHGDSHARKKQAKSMLDEGVKVGTLTQEQIDSLKTLIVDHTASKEQISAYAAANSAGMGFLYATVYRGMSFIGAHATIASTDSVFESRTDGFDMVFGPSDDGLHFCIGLVDTCLAEGIKRFEPLMPLA